MRELRRTCEDGHALIWHREWVCPLCEASETFRKELHEAQDSSNETHELRFEIEQLEGTISDLLATIEALKQDLVEVRRE